ncbi:MAG: hypothetical protein ACK4VV_01140 [Pseudomonas sp.]
MQQRGIDPDQTVDGRDAIVELQGRTCSVSEQGGLQAFASTDF